MCVFLIRVVVVRCTCLVSVVDTCLVEREGSDVELQPHTVCDGRSARVAMTKQHLLRYGAMDESRVWSVCHLLTLQHAAERERRSERDLCVSR